MLILLCKHQTQASMLGDKAKPVGCYQQLWFRRVIHKHIGNSLEMPALQPGKVCMAMGSSLSSSWRTAVMF